MFITNCCSFCSFYSNFPVTAPQSMNRRFFELLQSVAEAERDPHFFANHYANPRLNLMYPDNVIVVASPTGKAPPPAPNETRVTKLSHAVRAAVLRSDIGGKGCSILVHEGVYIDPLQFIPPCYTVPYSNYSHQDFSLEIVGTKNVRLILENQPVNVMTPKISFKNLLVYDRRLSHETPTFLLSFCLTAEFTNVKIHAPGATAVSILPRGGSKITVKRSVINGCYNGISVIQSDLRLEESIISDISEHGVTVRDAKFEARKTSFLNCNYSCVGLDNAHGIVDDCKFRGAYTGRGDLIDGVRKNQGLELRHGSQLTLQKSCLERLQGALLSAASNSKPIVRDCKITNCMTVVSLDFNSDALFEKCQLGPCDFVLTLSNNVSGKVEFRKNKMIKGAQPVFIKDQMSTPPLHDFRGLNNRILDEALHARWYTEGPSKKERSDYTKWAHEVGYKGDASLDPSDPRYGLEFTAYHKICQKCYRTEQAGTTKMKYCNGCEKACYCSRTCQMDDWPDHKLICVNRGKKGRDDEEGKSGRKAKR